MNNFTTTKKQVAIDLIDPNKWNPNVETPEMFAKVKANIEKYGFVDPVFVRAKGERYELIDGEHRWRAAKQLGYSEIICEVIEGLDDFDAALLTVNMNNLRGEDDPVKRGRIFKDLREKRPDLVAMLPFEEFQVQAEIDLITFNPEEEYKDAKPPVLDGTAKMSFVVSLDRVDLVSKVLAQYDENVDVAFNKLIDEAARLVTLAV